MPKQAFPFLLPRSVKRVARISCQAHLFVKNSLIRNPRPPLLLHKLPYPEATFSDIHASFHCLKPRMRNPPFLVSYGTYPCPNIALASRNYFSQAAKPCSNKISRPGFNTYRHRALGILLSEDTNIHKPKT